MLMEEKAIEEKKWRLEILDERPENEWRAYPTTHEITERFAEVVQRYSCDAYVNAYRKDIKMTIAGLVSLYNDYWRDE